MQLQMCHFKLKFASEVLVGILKSSLCSNK